MTMAYRRTRATNGPRLVKATIALATAATCLGLLVFLLTPYPTNATSGGTQTGLHGAVHGGASELNRPGLIPIAFARS